MASPSSVDQVPVDYETLNDGRIARIWLNRPEAHNAQNRILLVQLDEAFCRAEADDTVRVVIRAARGKNFSAGHAMYVLKRAARALVGSGGGRSSRFHRSPRATPTAGSAPTEWPSPRSIT